MLISTSVVTIPSHNGISDRTIPGTGEAVASVIMLLGAGTNIAILAALGGRSVTVRLQYLHNEHNPGISVHKGVPTACASMRAAISVQSRS